MKATSIQNIISGNNSPLRNNELQQLFTTRQYPRFQLRDLQDNQTLMKNHRFVFFMQVLERWNAKLQAKQASISELGYRKNQFIFSWLKGVAVQNTKCLDASLHKLYEWHSSNADPQIVCRLRGQNVNRSRLEDWQIRNAYKSNMPLEISSYHRRELFPDSSQNYRTLTQNRKDKQSTNQSCDKYNKLSPKLAKKENNFIRGVREEREMTDFLNTYKKTKVHFYKNMTKNYYRKEFSRDKQPINTFERMREKLQSGDHLKSYRIKTSLGQRSSKLMPNSSFNSTAYSNFHSPKQNLTFEMQKGQTSLGHSGSPQKQNMCASSIDGMGLLVNPFQTKMKKKRR